MKHYQKCNIQKNKLKNMKLRKQTRVYGNINKKAR